MPVGLLRLVSTRLLMHEQLHGRRGVGGLLLVSCQVYEAEESREPWFVH